MCTKKIASVLPQPAPFSSWCVPSTDSNTFITCSINTRTWRYYCSEHPLCLFTGWESSFLPVSRVLLSNIMTSLRSCTSTMPSSGTGTSISATVQMIQLLCQNHPSDRLFHHRCVDWLAVAFSRAYLWRIIWFPRESDIDKMRVILIHASLLVSSSSESWTAPPLPEILLSSRICLAIQYIYWEKLSVAIVVFFFNGYAVVALNSISRLLITCYYLRLSMSSLQWTIIEQLSSFADKDICPREKRSLAM